MHLKTTSKRAIQNTAEATGDLIGSKIADKITRKTIISVQTKKTAEILLEIPKEIFTPPEKRQVIDQLRLLI